MLLSELITKYHPLYPHEASWEDTKNYMLSDPTEKRIVDQLAKELIANGKFNNPIRLGKDHVANGTHRVVAAIISNAKQIDTITTKQFKKLQPDVRDEDDEAFVETSIILKGYVIEEELEDNIFSAVRSFRLNTEVWLESSLTYSTTKNSVRTLAVSWDNSDLDPSIFEEITQGVISQLAYFGYDKYGSTITTSLDIIDA